MSLYDPVTKIADATRWLGEEAIQEQARLQAKGSVFGASTALHDESINTYLLRFTEPFAWADFSRAMDMLQSVVGDRILRVKGLLNVQGESAPRILHAIQHERYAGEAVCPPGPTRIATPGWYSSCVICRAVCSTRLSAHFAARWTPGIKLQTGTRFAGNRYCSPNAAGEFMSRNSCQYVRLHDFTRRHASPRKTP